MSARQFFVDSLDFARNGRETSGVIAVVDMARLQDLLATPEGEINYVVRGFQDQAGKLTLEVRLEGFCQLRCQRCLQGFGYSIQLVSQLLLIPADEFDESSQEEGEMDAIVADTHLNLHDMIEEELLLNLPFAPKHPVGTCQPPVVVAEGKNSAFAVLAELKKKY